MFGELLKKTLPAAVIVLIVMLCSLLPLPWNEPIREQIIEWQFKWRGGRALSSNIALIYIGPEDVRDLGGWPLTRDYYGYLIHMLNERGARVIAFDLLFSSPDSRYPEYDRTFAFYIRSAGDVVLPMAYNVLERSGKGELCTGDGPVKPIAGLARAAAAVGFSNLETRATPVFAFEEDSLRRSFGLEMARLFLGAEVSYRDGTLVLAGGAGGDRFIRLEKGGRIRLNHFGRTADVPAVSLVDYLRAPDSLSVRGRLVLIAVTSPGLMTVHSTPLESTLPASLIHLTAAENLIANNHLRQCAPWIEAGLILVLGLAGAVCFRLQRTIRLLLCSAVLLGFLSALAQLVLCRFYHIVPLFYPCMTVLLLNLHTLYRRVRAGLSENLLLKCEIESVETELERAQLALSEARKDLQRQMSEKKALSEKSRQWLEEKTRAVLALENHLNDLKVCSTPATRRSGRVFPEIIHAPSSPLAEVLETVKKIGPENITVLIQGETGTGKEMIARAIHQSGPRSAAPFVALNCGALPETLLESELFGHEKGSFTGAHARRRGRFEISDGGTLFLDEITETTPGFQAKLLRVLQEGTFERLGGECTLQVDVRIIAASSRKLETEVEAGRFRIDLFYRLNGFPISLPPLRERPDDIEVLAAFFLRRHDSGASLQISESAMELLRRYRWPGNVRELENVVRRAAIMARSEHRTLIQSRDLPVETLAARDSNRESVYLPLEDQILETLRSMSFSHSAISATARALGNRDRGTVTEYLRGICFREMARAGYDIAAAASAVAGTAEPATVRRVHAKFAKYLENVERSLSNPDSLFAGLPTPYHPDLQKLIEHLSGGGQLRK